MPKMKSNRGAKKRFRAPMTDERQDKLRQSPADSFMLLDAASVEKIYSVVECSDQPSGQC